MRTLDIWYAHLDAQDDILAAAQRRRRQGKKQAKEVEARQEEPRQGPDARQPAGTVQARRDGRRAVPDRQPAADRGPAPRPGGRPRAVAEEVEAVIHDQFRAYRATLAERPTPAAGAVRDRRHRPQGGRGRQRRNPRVDRPAAGPGRAGPAVPAGQGGHGLGAGGPPAEEPLQAAGRAGGPRAADDAGRERHLPRLDKGRGGQPAPLLAAVARHEGLGRGRGDVAAALAFYAGVCGWTLARAHARSGDPVAIAAYLGRPDAFDRSIADFSKRYADQNERDYQAFVDAIQSGRLEALEGV